MIFSEVIFKKYVVEEPIPKEIIDIVVVITSSSSSIPSPCAAQPASAAGCERPARSCCHRLLLLLLVALPIRELGMVGTCAERCQIALLRLGGESVLLWLMVMMMLLRLLRWLPSPPAWVRMPPASPLGSLPAATSAFASCV